MDRIHCSNLPDVLFFKLIRPGTKVVITFYKHTPSFWNHEGKMDRWMGKTVTVAELGFDEQGGVFRIEEEPTWVWRFKDVDFVIINKDPNFLFRQKKAKEKES